MSRHAAYYLHPATGQLFRRGDLLGIGRREMQCLGMLRAGMTQAEVGRALGLATTTITSYVRNIRHKFGLETNKEILPAAERAGLFSKTIGDRGRPST